MTMHTGKNLIGFKQRRLTFKLKKRSFRLTGPRIGTAAKTCLIAINDCVIESIYHGVKAFKYGHLQNQEAINPE